MFLVTAVVHQSIADMARVVPELGHIDPTRVFVVAAPRAGAARHGNLAQCCALGEPEGEHLKYWYHPRARRVVRVAPWMRRVNTRVEIHGAPMAYVILLRLPRLLEHDAVETVVHELLHIGPRCDGRLRRMRHGKRFDGMVAHMSDTWRRRGDPRLVEALGATPERARATWGPIAAASFGAPFEPCRYVPMDDPPPFESHPDFQRLGLEFDRRRVEVVDAPLSGERVPDLLTERDLVYRVYTGRRTERISASALHAVRSLFPADAFELENPERRAL